MKTNIEIMESNFEKLDCFIPAKLAFELKKIGFDKECILQYTDVYQEEHYFINFAYGENTDISIDLEDCTLKKNSDLKNDCLSLYKEFRMAVMIPTWEQVFKWFREKGFRISLENHEDSTKFIFYNMKINKGKHFKGEYSNYEEARENLINKLIEIYGNK